MSKVIIVDAYIDHAIHFYLEDKMKWKQPTKVEAHADIYAYLCKGYPVEKRGGEQIIKDILTEKLNIIYLNKLITEE